MPVPEHTLTEAQEKRYGYPDLLHAGQWSLLMDWIKGGALD